MTIQIDRWLVFGLLISGLAQPATGATLVFQQDFDQLPLQPSVDEPFFPEAFTHQPPDDWFRVASGVPGVGDPDLGVTEWEGWSFADKNFWVEVSEDEDRGQFELGQGTVAVADPGQWNDLGNPANTAGFYNTLLGTPAFDVAALKEQGGTLKLEFDSSWRPQCCDDGRQFDPRGNNKTALLRARYEDGTLVDLLRWESAPFVDSQGEPSTDPDDMPNPLFKATDLNETVLVDLSGLLTSLHADFKLEFGLLRAGDDWWWAMDNVRMYSYFTLLGDMDLSGFIDVGDIGAFALAMQSTDAYRTEYFGEFPVTRGSLDSIFDFDDIDWFVEVLNDNGVTASTATVLAAIRAIPEPSSGCLLWGCLLGSCLLWRVGVGPMALGLW